MRLHVKVQEILQKYKELQDIIAILGMEELADEDKVTGIPCKKDSEVPVTAVPCSRELHRYSRVYMFR